MCSVSIHIVCKCIFELSFHNLPDIVPKWNSFESIADLLEPFQCSVGPCCHFALQQAKEECCSLHCDEQQQARKVYSHQMCVCEWCAVDVNLVQKQVNGWDTSEMKELVYYNVKTLTWDTSEMKELVDQGVQGTLLILYRAYCSTQDNKACTRSK